MTTFSEEAKSLRIEVAKLRPGRGRKYSVQFRRRVIAWVGRAVETGMLEADCSQMLGIPQHRFEMWREKERCDVGEDTSSISSTALVPVDFTPPPIQVSLGLTFVTPSGYRIEGLALEQAFALLREYVCS